MAKKAESKENSESADAARCSRDLRQDLQPFKHVGLAIQSRPRNLLSVWKEEQVCSPSKFRPRHAVGCFLISGAYSGTRLAFSCSHATQVGLAISRVLRQLSSRCLASTGRCYLLVRLLPHIDQPQDAPVDASAQQGSFRGPHARDSTDTDHLMSVQANGRVRFGGNGRARGGGERKPAFEMLVLVRHKESFWRV